MIQQLEQHFDNLCQLLFSQLQEIEKLIKKEVLQ